MKRFALMLLLTSTASFAGPDIYEKYEGVSDKNEICSFTISKYPEDDSFHYQIQFPDDFGTYSLWAETLPAEIPLGKYNDPEDTTSCGFDTKREKNQLSIRRLESGDFSHTYTQADLKYSDSSLSSLISVAVQRADSCLEIEMGLQKNRTCKNMKRVQ